MTPTRGPLDAAGVATTLAVVVVWGFNHVVAKLAAPGISLVTQASIRFAFALVLVLAWARWRGRIFATTDGTLGPGVLTGLVFAGEFLCIFWGLAHTTASRMAVFVYVAPCVTAIGLHYLVPAERISARQWAGMLIAFAGLFAAFSDGFLAADRSTLFGDTLAIVGGILWGGTTIMIRATRLASASPEKTMAYQVLVAALVLPLCALAIGEPGVVALTPFVIVNMLWQILAVSFASYLAWFWLLTRYRASHLAAFTFVAPLVGVAAGALVLGEPLTLTFVAGAVLVAFGVTLVNWRGRS